MRRPESRTARLSIAFLLGAASVLAYAPIGAFPLLWFTLAGLYALLTGTTPSQKPMRDAALLGAAFGFGLFITGVSWVYVSLSIFGGLPAAVAGLATVLFCAFLALYPALVGALFVRLLPAAWWQGALLFASLWTLSEYLRGWLLTGFPWLAIGYAQTPPSPLAGLAPIFGVFGASWATALLAALLVEGWRRLSPHRGRSRWHRAAPLLVVGALLAGSQALRSIVWTTPTGAPISVALLQGNVPQDVKWRPEAFNDSLLAYYRLALENPAQLTVLPETALPAFLANVPDEYLDALAKLAQRENGDMLIGIPFGDRNHYANGAVSLGASPSQRYSKSHLVPFGEFVPPGFAWFLAMANIPMSDFTPGARHQAPLQIAGQSVAVNICYEDAFGEEIIRALPAASLLVNMSNVAWFGDSLAPAQHLQIARLRALETGRIMLLATNTGMTAIVGVDGKIEAELPPFTRSALRGEVRAYQGVTPYVRWGNWPVILVSLGLLLIAGWRRHLTRNAHKALS